MTTDRIVALDGRDALAFVILRPGETPEAGAVIEAAANGVSKEYAAHALRHVADQWAPQTAEKAVIEAARAWREARLGNFEHRLMTEELVAAVDALAAASTE